MIIIARIIILFSPLRVFLPLSGFLFILGCAMLIYNLASLNVQESTIFLLLTAILIFGFGLLADQLAHIRREIK